MMSAEMGHDAGHLDLRRGQGTPAQVEKLLSWDARFVLLGGVANGYVFLMELRALEKILVVGSNPESHLWATAETSRRDNDSMQLGGAVKRDSGTGLNGEVDQLLLLH